MAANFHSFFVKFALMALVFVGIFGWIIGMQADNDLDYDKSIVSEKLINDSYGNLRTDINSYADSAQTQKTLFETETPTTGFGSLILFSIVSSGKVFNGMTIGFFNTMIQLPITYLGVDPSTIGILSIMIILTIIIGLWVLYKLGG